MRERKKAISVVAFVAVDLTGGRILFTKSQFESAYI